MSEGAVGAIGTSLFLLEELAFNSLEVVAESLSLLLLLLGLRTTVVIIATATAASSSP